MSETKNTIFDARLDPRLSTHELGSIGERIVEEQLKLFGYKLLERNYRCSEGEADLIMFDLTEEEIVLIEVKTRRVYDFNRDIFPEEAVTLKKLKRYRRIASCYALDKFPVSKIRFDVVAVKVYPNFSAELLHDFDLFSWEADQ